MGDIRDQARTVYRDAETPGSNVPHEPVKSEIRALFGTVEDGIAGAVDIATVGVRWTNQNIRVRSTGNVAIATALENGDTLNGVVLATGNTVFLGSQTDSSQNGLYTVPASGAAARATFADSAAELARIAFLISEGTAGAGERWTLPMDAGEITVGTTGLVFSRIGIEVSVAQEVADARGAEATLEDRIDAVDEKVRLEAGENTAVGDGAGSGSGTANTAFGALALRDITTGTGNTAVGQQALRENEAGGNNVAVGNTAERLNVSGLRNVTVGDSAGGSRTDGDDNVAIGFGAQGGVGAGGNLNVAVGRSALSDYADSDAVAVGAYALEATTGIRNVAVGSQAGQAITSGEYNLALGYNAMNAVGQLPTAFNSIALGFNSITNKDNQIALGNDGHDEVTFFEQVMFRKGGTLSFFAGGAGNLTAVNGANVAIGHTAGFSMTLADSCVLLGYEAGYQMTSGGNNVAVGARALVNATTASDCTAIGAGALNQMVTGVGTTAVGRYALQTIEEGGNSTAIGDASGRNAHGEQNCLMGYGVMRYNYAGSYNVVLGQGALYVAGKAPGGDPAQPENGGDPGPLVRTGGVVTGPHNPSNFNAIVGWEAFGQTTGGGNTALGAQAGRSLTSGDDNIFIGREAGFGGTQLVSASGTVVIGVGAVSTRDDEVVIGKSSDTHVTLAGVEFTKAQLVALLALV